MIKIFEHGILTLLNSSLRTKPDLKIMVVILYTTFIVYGYFHEKILTRKYNNELFTTYIFLSFLHNLAAIFVSYILMEKTQNKNENNFLIFEYFKCSILKLISSQIGFVATKYLNYPTILIAKSCKVLPVLIMNLVIYNRKFSGTKYTSAIILTVGVILFTFKNKTGGNVDFNLTKGSFYLISNLVIEGSMHCLQDNIFLKYKISSYHMMFYTNLILSIFSALLLGYSSEILVAISFIVRNYEILPDLIFFLVLGIFIQVMVFLILESYGAITVSSILIGRKIISIVASIIIFKHKLSLFQLVGFFMVLMSFMMKDGKKKD